MLDRVKKTTLPSSAKHNRMYVAIRAYTLKKFGTTKPSSLLREMLIKAEGDQSYAVALDKWFKHGSTLHLREITKMFGNYWRDIDFSNDVDALDASWSIANQALKSAGIARRPS